MAVNKSPKLEILRVVSIDPGIKNFAFYTEDIVPSRIASFKKKIKGRGGRIKNIDDNILTEVYSEGCSLIEGTGVYELVDSEIKLNKIKLNNEIREKLYYLLEKYKPLWESCHHVIIEEQFICVGGANKGTVNMKLVKIAEAVYTWLLSRYPNINISYFPPRTKYVFNKCPIFTEKINRKTKAVTQVKMKKSDRKLWGIQKGKEILKYKGEEELIERLDSTKGDSKQKLDDICDCILQLQAFKWSAKF